MKSVAQHLREEIWDVVTSVSAAFRLSDLEAEHQARRPPAHTPARGVAAAAHRRSGMLIPASRLTAGPAAGRATEASPFVRTGLEHTAIGQPAPPAEALRPRTHRRSTTSSAALPVLRAQLTTDVVPSLRALEAAAGLSGTSPIGAHTDETAALRRSLDGPTDEMTSLRAREQQAAQITALRQGNDPTSILAVRPAARDATGAAVPPPAAGDPTRVVAALRAAGERPPAAAPPTAGDTPRAVSPVPRSPTVTGTVTVATALPIDEFPTALPIDEFPTDEIASLRALEETANERPSLRVRERAAAARHAFDHTDVVAIASPAVAQPPAPRPPSANAAGSIQTDRPASRAPTSSRRARRPSDPVVTSALRPPSALAAPDATPPTPPRRTGPPPIPPRPAPLARGSEPMPHRPAPDALAADAERTQLPAPAAPATRSAPVRTRLAR
jgi:hypothetical protein